MSFLFEFEDEFLVRVCGRVCCSSSRMSLLFKFEDEFLV